MEGGGGDAADQHDYHELEMLLKEIPCATCAVAQREQTARGRVPLRVDGLRPAREEEEGSMRSGSTAFSGDRSPRAVSFGSERNLRGILIDHEGAAANGKGKEEPNLPDDQYLSSAFEEMSLSEVAVRERMACEVAKYDRVLPQRVLRLGQQDPYASDFFGFEPSMAPSPPTLSGAARRSPAEMLGTWFDNVDGYGSVFTDQERRLEHSGRLAFDAYDRARRNACFALNVNSGANAYLLSGWEGASSASPSRQPYQFSPAPMYVMPCAAQHGATWRSNEEAMYRQRLQAEMFYSMDANRRSSTNLWPSGSVDQAAFWFDQQDGLHRIDGRFSTGYGKHGQRATSNGACKFYAQGFCSKGSGCSFSHGRKEISALDRILTRSRGLNSPRTASSSLINGAFNSTDPSRMLLPNGLRNHNPSPIETSIPTRRRAAPHPSPDDPIPRRALKVHSSKFSSLDEVVGHICSLAKDQDGCRRLQEKFQEGSREDVDKVFKEITENIVELMTDPFGNYLIQKLLEYCNSHQKTLIVNAITADRRELFRISCDMHGTRAVQKMIETLSTPEQFSRIASALSPFVVELMKDVNGNHVAQRCLQFSLPEYSAFVYEAADADFAELATDRHGCCVLQKCFVHANDAQQRVLVSNVASRVIALSMDPFGNYVVQCAVKTSPMPVKAEILNQLQGHYVELSMQKCGSHVVEKCLSSVDEAQQACIVHELLNHPQISEIMQNQYGNYVIQKALEECHGPLRAALVQAVGFYQSVLRSSQFGKKVLPSAGFKR